ncbi:MAG: hypothetical protein HYY50_00485 [Candidatus Kerfeldbacteria bacterium]|nr:hypothetical protein [Candidatus Kerfeldbacteria bacterium]
MSLIGGSVYDVLVGMLLGLVLAAVVAAGRRRWGAQSRRLVWSRPTWHFDLSSYTSAEHFERMERDGYTDIMLGEGPWVDHVRILRAVFFIRPDGRVVAVALPKQMDHRGMTMHVGTREFNLPAGEFTRFLVDYQIRIVHHQRLSDALHSLVA